MFRYLSVLGFFVVSACLAPEPEPSPEVCRPVDVEAAVLGIGRLEFQPRSLIAQVQEDPTTGAFGIHIQLDEAAAGRMATLTRESIGQALELRLDADVVATPTVTTPILDGRILIQGDFTRFAATEIVERLAPPCPVTDAPSE